jgi:hypothetical protein
MTLFCSAINEEKRYDGNEGKLFGREKVKKSGKINKRKRENLRESDE